MNSATKSLTGVKKDIPGMVGRHPRDARDTGLGLEPCGGEKFKSSAFLPGLRLLRGCRDLGLFCRRRSKAA